MGKKKNKKKNQPTIQQPGRCTFHAEKPKNTLLSSPVCGQNNGPNPLQGDGQHARQDTQNAQPSHQMPMMTPRHTPTGCNNQNAPLVHTRSFQLRTLEKSQHVPHSL